jgi:integrase
MTKDLLSAAECKNATSGANAVRKLPDGDGLYLWVYADGRKYWRMRYWSADKEKSLSVGVYPKVTLAQARKRAEEVRAQIQAGDDPSKVRKDTASANKLAAENTFEVVAREWYGKQEHTRAASHAVDVKRRLESNIYPHLGARPISEITPPEILTTVQKIEARGAHDLAHRVLGVVGQVLRYGVATKRCTSDVSRDLRGALTPHVKANQPASRARTCRTSYGRFAYDQSPTNGETQTRLALQFLALTFTRTNELIGAKRTEFDREGQMWVIPASRMKGKKEHLVPLSRQAIGVLDQLMVLAGDSEYLLPGRNPQKPISNNTMLFELYRLGYKGKMTGHGFRAVASTWLNESNAFDSDWIERQLAHVPDNAVRGAYNRAKYIEQRTRMMQVWADHLDAVVVSNVTALRAA